jgi:peptidoglycan hydrolase-like protein with peptidoglycan-binding domain
MVAAVQRALAQRGYYKGRIDDKMGPGTRRAIKEFQRNQGLPMSGRVDTATIEALKLDERR